MRFFEWMVRAQRALTRSRHTTGTISRRWAGGNKPNDAFHTDATKASTWEYFYFLKCGDLGSGYQYAIRPTGTGNIPGKGDLVSYLTALGGGGKTSQAMTAFSGLQADRCSSIKQKTTGTYALQTSSGNYVTAVNGGGLASGDNLHTDAQQVQPQKGQDRRRTATKLFLHDSNGHRSIFSPLVPDTLPFRHASATPMPLHHRLQRKIRAHHDRFVTCQ